MRTPSWLLLELFLAQRHLLGVPSRFDVYSVDDGFCCILVTFGHYPYLAAKTERPTRLVYPWSVLHPNWLCSWIPHIDVKLDVLESEVSRLKSEQFPVVLLLGLSESWLFGCQLDRVVADLDEHDALHHASKPEEIKIALLEHTCFHVLHQLFVEFLNLVLCCDCTSTKGTSWVDQHGFGDAFWAE